MRLIGGEVWLPVEEAHTGMVTLNAKRVKVCMQSRDKDVGHTQEVNYIRDPKYIVHLSHKLKNIMVFACDRNLDIAPKLLYPGNEIISIYKFE